jgi:hypothetical protein
MRINDDLPLKKHFLTNFLGHDSRRQTSVPVHYLYITRVCCPLFFKKQSASNT